MVVIVFPPAVFGLIQLNKRYRREAEALAKAPASADAADAHPDLGHGPGRLGGPGRDQDAALRPLAAPDRGARGPPDGRQPATPSSCASSGTPRRPRTSRWRSSRSRTAASAAPRWNSRPRETAEGYEVTVLLPRRTYSPIVGRLLHDRTADRLAEVLSTLPHVVATIVPFDVVEAIEELQLAEKGRKPKARDGDPGAGVGAHAAAKPRVDEEDAAGRRVRDGPGPGPRSPGPAEPDLDRSSGASAPRSRAASARWRCRR